MDLYKDELYSYLSIPEKTEGALIITGEWGAGKTTFVKDILEGSDERYLYVSLAGISEKKDIEQSLLLQKLKILGRSGSKKIKAASWFMSAFKNLKMSSGGISFSLGELGASSVLDVLGVQIQETIVFDDVERSELTALDSLGVFLNYYDMSSTGKIIIIVNEKEFEDDRFSSVKEKVEYKTINFKYGVTGFLEKIHCEGEGKDFIDVVRRAVGRAFSDGNNNNLRLAKRVFHLIFSLLNRFDCVGFDESFYYFFSYNFSSLFVAVNTGLLHLEDINKITLLSVSRNRNFNGEEDAQEVRINRFLEKFSKVDVYSIFSAKSIYFSIISGSPVSRSDFYHAFGLSDSEGYDAKRAWVQAWYMYSCVDNDSYRRICRDFFKELDSLVYTRPHVILHAMMILYSIFTLEGIDDKESATSRRVGRYRQEIMNPLEVILIGGSQAGFSGLGYHNSDSDIFYAVRDRIDDAVSYLILDLIRSNSERLLRLLFRYPQQSCRRIHRGSGGSYLYDQFPVFSFFDARSFARSFLRLQMADKRAIISVLEGRANMLEDAEKLREEVYFLEMVCVEVDSISDSLGSIEKHVACQGALSLRGALEVMRVRI